MKKKQNLENFNNLEQLFEKIKNITLIERIFSWKNIRSLSYDAYDEFKSIDKIIDDNQKILDDLNHKKDLLEKDLSNSKENLNNFKSDNKVKSEKINDLNNQIKDLTSKLSKLEGVKENEQKEYIKNIEQLNKSQEQLNKDRIRLQEERDEEKEKQFEAMKNTWKTHELDVEHKLKLICKNRELEYISKEKVPFKGKPDNTIKIGEQYIIFDAKSPLNDNLDNFPKYLKDQANKIEKYTKEKDVRNSVYLVVPHNTIEILKEKLKEFCLNVSNYKVYIVSIDSLEPIFESLEEILKYKYVDQLSPEQRDKIAEIIGRFAHSTKRKIQIDNWANQEFLYILDSCNDLDEKTKLASVEKEKSYKLNPDMDKIGKLVDVTKLDEDIKIIDHKVKLKNKKLIKGKKK